MAAPTGPVGVPSRFPASGDQRAWLFTALLAAAAGTLTLLVVTRITASFPHLEVPFWVFVPLFAVAELMVFHVHIGRSTHTLSLSETPLVAGLALVAPLGLIASRVLGTLYTLTFHTRVPPLKLGFNLAMVWLEAVVAVLVWHTIVGGADPLSPRGWLAALLAAIGADVLAGICVMVVVSLTEGPRAREQFGALFYAGLRTAFVNASFGVVVVTVLASDWRGIWALAVVGGTLTLSYRAYAGVKRSHDEMKQINAFTRTIGQSLETEVVAISLLEQALRLLRADLAEIRLTEPGGTLCLRLRDGKLRRLPVEMAPPVELSDRVLISEGTSVAPGKHPAGWGRIRELLAVPLRGDAGAIVGELWVVNRVDDVTTFEEHDLQLLETIANQAAVMLDNSRLVAQLRTQADETLHQARHDELTGLPNRAQFQERARDVLGGMGRAAVLLLDLDRFKEINDTLGHDAGDQLLRQVADRLRISTAPGVTVARLGGDEFAILLPGVATEDAASIAAHQVLGGFEVPFAIDGLSLDVAVSLGLVLAPTHGDQPEVLLQRADVAMYQAKERGTGIEVYDPARDPYSPRRLAMSNDLRRAIETEQLAVHFQPKLDLLTGGIRGVEALVRWAHPEFGRMSPAEFIPLAEQTGLVVPLTEFVLRTSLQQCRSWHARGASVELAVNVSARSLLDVHFPELVERLLHDARMAPEVLTLEITETGILVDSVRTKEILERLSGMGVKLAIDDFGTGYSSLARLKHLPVDELKIDRSFVSNMTVNADDHAIVQSTIDLGRNLGLLVVAEGIEDAATVQRLCDLGCHVGQGFWFGAPVPAEHLSARLGIDTTLALRRIGG